MKNNKLKETSASIPKNENNRSDAVARRAYDLYLQRGAQPGHELDDWIQAEREIKGSQAPRPLV
jgi:hypothetical protein